METAYPLRLYANSAKMALYVGLSAAFTVGGVWIFQSSLQHGDVFKTIIGAVATLFLGGAAMLIASLLVESVLFRRPSLEIDGLGWRFHYLLFRGAVTIPWQDITLITCYRQSFSSRSNLYYLSVRVRDTSRLPHSRMRALNARLLPSMRNAAFAAQLNQVFWRCTSEACVSLLDRIGAMYSHEMQQYGIRMQHMLGKL